ncbi:remorin [Prunus yedoensis var. nudiflora]|uniref:Remorin n=1 Tax=Prunus yedoensis var. nudiflora TaxID=2094558 RepID=A0A314XU71_PRUYE|nr:remorin [Prunus yedoensis var. nudiflora]
MGATMEEELKKAEPEPALLAEPPLASAPNDVAEEKAVVPPPREVDVKGVDDTKALSVVEKAPETVVKKPSGGSIDRDIALSHLEKEKSLSFIRAWEESEKAKAENKAQKKLSDITAWENSRKASVEAKLRSKEEKLEKKKAQYAEKMKNQVALLHKQADEKRALAIANRGEDFLKADETAAKYRATGSIPKKFLGCF